MRDTFNSGPSNPSGGPSNQPGQGGGQGGQNPLSQLMNSLGKLFGGSQQPVPGLPCPADQNAFLQYQQQYNQQLQQHQYQMQQYQYQQQQNSYYGYQGNMMQPIAPVPCTQQPQQCPQVAQPDPSQCTVGTWKPVYTGSCVSNWQCVPNTGSGATNQIPSAQISCQPQVADVGMSLAIAYACQNSTTASGSGFDTSSGLTGSATAVVAAPPGNTNTATYSLTCTGQQSQTASAQCTVQINKPTIVLVANPKTVQSGAASSIGWVTSGMQSCVISSPTLVAFTAQNAGNTAVSGVAQTPALTAAAEFDLKCTTQGCATRMASTSVSIK